MSLEDTAFLTELYNRYLDAAKRQEAAGHYIDCKRNYMLAAQTLLKIAKKSSPELQKTRLARAKKLLEKADSIVVNPGKVVVNQGTKTVGNPSSGQTNAESQSEEEGKWKAAKIPDIHFSDIAGLENVKETIRTKMINPYLYPEKYKLYGKSSGGGVLLYGPPGTGKTMIAKAIAAEVGAAFYSVKSSDIVSKWVGDSEQNIATLFEAASKQPKAVIFVDEMDSLFAKRGEDPHNDKRVNEFLQQIDGFSGRNPNLLLLGATNRPWDIDEAATRSGRFSVKIYVPLPDPKAREYLISHKIKDLPLADDIDLPALVAATKGFSGADIVDCVDRASDRALNEYIRSDAVCKITQKDFLRAINLVLSGINLASIRAFEEYAARNNGLMFHVEEDEVPMDVSPIETPAPAPAPEPEPVPAPEPTPEIEPLPEPVVETPKISVALAQDTFDYLPTKKYQVVFALSSPVEEKIYLDLGSSKVMADKVLGNYTSKEFAVEKAGDLEIAIKTMNEKPVASFTLHFTQGIEENDMGL